MKTLDAARESGVSSVLLAQEMALCNSGIFTYGGGGSVTGSWWLEV